MIFCMPLCLTTPSFHRELFLDFSSIFSSKRFQAAIKARWMRKGQLQANTTELQGTYKTNLERGYLVGPSRNLRSSAKSTTSIAMKRRRGQGKAGKQPSNAGGGGVRRIKKLASDGAAAATSASAAAASDSAAATNASAAAASISAATTSASSAAANASAAAPSDSAAAANASAAAPSDSASAPSDSAPVGVLHPAIVCSGIDPRDQLQSDHVAPRNHLTRTGKLCTLRSIGLEYDHNPTDLRRICVNFKKFGAEAKYLTEKQTLTSGETLRLPLAQAALDQLIGIWGFFSFEDDCTFQVPFRLTQYRGGMIKMFVHTADPERKFFVCRRIVLLCMFLHTTIISL